MGIFGYLRITVRDGKGAKDRVTMLPINLAKPLERHLRRVTCATRGRCQSWIWPRLFAVCAGAQISKPPDREWGVAVRFSITRGLTIDPRSEGKDRRRRPVDETVLQDAAEESTYAHQESRNPRLATRYAIPLPRTYSKTVTTFKRCRSCSVAKT